MPETETRAIAQDRHAAPFARTAYPSVSTAVVFVCLALCVLLLAGTANRGFGLTDEAFYVAWIGAPERYQANIAPFGPPLHLIFELVGRSLIALRIIGMALLLVTGAILGRSLGRYYHAIGVTWLPRPTLAALGGIAGLSYYALWILTPSYNLLANAGGQLILAGALEWMAADGARQREDVHHGMPVGALLMGLGGCLAFFGKPPLAGIAGLCVAGLVACSASARGIRAVAPGLVVLLVSCVLPMIAVIVLMGGPTDFVAKLVEGVRVLDFGNSPLSLPLKTFRNVFENSPLVLAGILLILVVAWSRGGAASDASGGDRPQLLAAFEISLGFVGLYAVMLLLQGVRGGERAWTFNGLPIACVAMAIVALCILHSTRPVASWRVLLPPILLLLVPFATALGTANRFVHQTGASSYGFLLAAPIAAWIFLNAKAARRIGAGTAVFTLAMLTWSAAKPYGLTAPIWAQNIPLTVPFASDSVLVSAETGRYAQTLRRVAAQGGLSPITPVIDLSEGGPGTALLLDARTPYYPWILHETKIPGSLADVAWQTLNADQQRRAWIVGPVRSEFGSTRLAALLVARRACYKRFSGLRMTFWDQVKTFELWVPNGACDTVRAQATGKVPLPR